MLLSAHLMDPLVIMLKFYVTKLQNQLSHLLYGANVCTHKDTHTSTHI